jgi:hypothetical protein
MILNTGQGTIRSNVTALMQPPVSRSRKRAIITLARKKNISKQQAQFQQAKAIAISQSRK